MARAPGPSVRLKLTVSYAAFLTVGGAFLLAVVWAFLVRERSALYLPGVDDFRLIADPRNFGPRVFSPAAVAALGFLMLFGLVGGWVLAGRMLAPLHRITDATRLAGGGSLAHRIRLPGRRDELRELADAFDDMLARLESHVAEQERFAANASHELRTPLAVTRTLLDAASRDRQRDQRQVLDQLRAVNTRAIDLTEALLLLGRAGRHGFVREPVDLSLTAEDATEALLPLADRHGVAIEVVGDPTPVSGSPALLLQMATNLVHNAIVHNLPDAGRVRVATSVQPAGAELTVENTGEELDPGLVATLTEPFQRASQRVRSDHAGVGLGLAIVERIARAHDGSLDLAPRSGGGLRVTVRLPASSGPTSAVPRLA